MITGAATAAVLHLIALLWPGNLLAIPGAITIEALMLGSLAVFVAVRRSSKPERRIASVSIFVSSLVLALSAPAALLPPAAIRGEAWAAWGRVVTDIPPALTFAIWSISLLLGGLAMHGLTNRRWKLAATRNG